MKCYLGVDIGSISTKGVIIDEKNNILASSYIWTEGNPVEAVKKLINILKKQMPKNCEIYGIGTTGSARKLIGLMLNANIVKNEITAHAVGTINFHPDVKTILEIGGQDSKIIIIRNGIIVDYAMNTLCAAGTGSFLSSQAKRLSIPIEEFGTYALNSKNPAKIAARCTVFAESEVVSLIAQNKATDDIVHGLNKAVAAKTASLVKRVGGEEAYMMTGGVAQNQGLVRTLEERLGTKLVISDKSQLCGALGAALFAAEM